MGDTQTKWLHQCFLLLLLFKMFLKVKKKIKNCITLFYIPVYHKFKWYLLGTIFWLVKIGVFSYQVLLQVSTWNNFSAEGGLTLYLENQAEIAFQNCCIFFYYFELGEDNITLFEKDVENILGRLQASCSILKHPLVDDQIHVSLHFPPSSWHLAQNCSGKACICMLSYGCWKHAPCQRISQQPIGKFLMNHCHTEENINERHILANI